MCMSSMARRSKLQRVRWGIKPWAHLAWIHHPLGQQLAVDEAKYGLQGVVTSSQADQMGGRGALVDGPL